MMLKRYAGLLRDQTSSILLGDTVDHKNRETSSGSIVFRIKKINLLSSTTIEKNTSMQMWVVLKIVGPISLGVMLRQLVYRDAKKGP